MILDRSKIQAFSVERTDLNVSKVLCITPRVLYIWIIAMVGEVMYDGSQDIPP